MAKDVLFAGEMNQMVDVFEYITTKNLSGETVKAYQLLQKKWVKRVDVRGDEVQDGRLVPDVQVKYLMRYDEDMKINGTKYFIRDFDGDYQIVSVAIFGQKRKSFLEIKAERRGE